MHVNGSSGPPPGPKSTAPTTPPARRFLGVAMVAAEIGMSEATLYRAIRAGEFPAVRVRNRYVVPVRVLDAMEEAALSTGSLVDAADWVDRTGVA